MLTDEAVQRCAEVIRAIEFVVPALEILDSRYNGRGRNLLVDSIADAATCGFVVLGGRPMKLNELDLRRVGASLAINGDIMETGTAGAVMGNPLNAIVWLANKRHEFGEAAWRWNPAMSSWRARS